MRQFCETRNRVLRRLLAMRLQSNGHLSGPMGLVDFLTFLYFYQMAVDPKSPRFPERDRFILSGYHYPVLYCTLAERGFFDQRLVEQVGEGDLKPNNTTPGFELSSNTSLGQGLAIANGMALSLRLQDLPSAKIYVIIGDGECNEGQIWEALLTTIKYNITQVITVVNVNHLQLDGPTMSAIQDGLHGVFAALGFEVSHADGHDPFCMREVFSSLSIRRPNAIFVRTTKGRGVSFIEAEPMRFHACQLSREEYVAALREVK